MNRYDVLQARDIIKRLRHPGTEADAMRARAAAVRLICKLGRRARLGEEQNQLLELLAEEAAKERTRRHAVEA